MQVSEEYFRLDCVATCMFQAFDLRTYMPISTSVSYRLDICLHLFFFSFFGFFMVIMF